MVIDWIGHMVDSGDHKPVSEALRKYPNWCRSPEVAERLVGPDTSDVYRQVARFLPDQLEGLMAALPDRSYQRLVTNPPSGLAAELVLLSETAARRLPGRIRELLSFSDDPNLRVCVLNNPGFGAAAHHYAVVSPPEQGSGSAAVRYSEAAEQIATMFVLSDDLLQVVGVSDLLNCYAPKVVEGTLSWLRRPYVSRRVTPQEIVVFCDSLLNSPYATHDLRSLWLRTVISWSHIAANDLSFVPWGRLLKDQGVPTPPNGPSATETRKVGYVKAMLRCVRDAAEAAHDPVYVEQLRFQLLEEEVETAQEARMLTFSAITATEEWLSRYGTVCDPDRTSRLLTRMGEVLAEIWEEHHISGAEDLSDLTFWEHLPRTSPTLLEGAVPRMLTWFPFWVLVNQFPEPVLAAVSARDPAVDMGLVMTAAVANPQMAWPHLRALL